METTVSRPVTEADLPGIGETLAFEGHIKKRQTGIWLFHRIPFPKGLNNITSAGWSEVNARSAVLYLGVSDEKHAVLVANIDIISSEDKGGNLPVEISFEATVEDYLNVDEYDRFVRNHNL